MTFVQLCVEEDVILDIFCFPYMLICIGKWKVFIVLCPTDLFAVQDGVIEQISYFYY